MNNILLLNIFNSIFEDNETIKLLTQANYKDNLLDQVAQDKQHIAELEIILFNNL